VVIVKTDIVLLDSVEGQNKGKLAFVLSDVFDIEYYNHLIKITYVSPVLI
jgi:hypothetical protein